MTSIKVCGVPILEWCTTSIGAPLSAGQRGPGVQDWRDFVATIRCSTVCKLDPSPCWAYSSRDDLPTTTLNIAGCFLVHMKFSSQMSGMYVASSTTARWLDASTFRKTISYRWSCWIAVSACSCASIGANILSPMFQASLLGARRTAEFAENFTGSWFKVFLANCKWSLGHSSLKLMNTFVLCYHADHIDPQHSFLGQSRSKYLVRTDSGGSHSGSRYPRQFAAGILLVESRQFAAGILLVAPIFHLIKTLWTCQLS